MGPALDCFVKTYLQPLIHTVDHNQHLGGRKPRESACFFIHGRDRTSFKKNVTTIEYWIKL